MIFTVLFQRFQQPVFCFQHQIFLAENLLARPKFYCKIKDFGSFPQPVENPCGKLVFSGFSTGLQSYLQSFQQAVGNFLTKYIKYRDFPRILRFPQ